ISSEKKAAESAPAWNLSNEELVGHLIPNFKDGTSMALARYLRGGRPHTGSENELFEAVGEYPELKERLEANRNQKHLAHGGSRESNAPVGHLTAQDINQVLNEFFHANGSATPTSWPKFDGPSPAPQPPAKK